MFKFAVLLNLAIDISYVYFISLKNCKKHKMQCSTKHSGRFNMVPTFEHSCMTKSLKTRNLSLVASQHSGIDMKCVGLLRFRAESTMSSIRDLAENRPALS